MPLKFARYLALPGVLLAILAAGLDVVQWLRAAPLWVDEEMIALNFRDRPFADLAGPLWLGQSAPLAWLFAQRIVVLLLGTGELALRLVPLLFGLGTLVCAVWIGARWMGRLGAGLLILLCAIAQWMSHYRFEVKHYSADAFWALLLPALAVWTLENTCSPERSTRRFLTWWGAGAVGLWFSYGALFVVPFCALFLFAAIVRQRGVRMGTQFALAGVVWLASFGLNYALSLQYTHHNRYLRTYWAREFPPDAAGVAGILAWAGERLRPLAENPGGTELGVAFWLCAALGLVIASPATLGAAFATVPLSAFVLASLHLVPLHDRFALWIVPALYVGIALLFDRGVRAMGRSWTQRQWQGIALGAVLALAALPAIADILATGKRNLDVGSPGNHNHAVDDRSAVRWLMQRRHPGDALVTTRLGWPAIWWYGGISPALRGPQGRLPDGSFMYRLSHENGGCGAEVQSLFEQHPRVLVHIGFPDTPDGFRELLFRDLARFGRIVESAEFSELSWVAIVEPLRGHPGAAEAPLSRRAQRLGGCVSARPMRRW